jgi:hypothetical protein
MTINRRAFLNACTSAGIASPLLPGILYTLAAQAQESAPAASGTATPNTGSESKAPTLPKITPEMIDRAGELAGVGPFTDAQKKMMLDGLNDQRDAYAQIRALKIERAQRRNWYLTTLSPASQKLLPTLRISRLLPCSN